MASPTTLPKVLIVADREPWKGRAGEYLAHTLMCQVEVLGSTEAVLNKAALLPEHYDIVFVDEALQEGCAVGLALWVKAQRPKGGVYLATHDFTVEKRVPELLSSGVKLIDRCPLDFDGELKGHLALFCFYHVRGLNHFSDNPKKLTKSA